MHTISDRDTDLLAFFAILESPLPSNALFLSLMVTKLDVKEDFVKNGRGGLRQDGQYPSNKLNSTRV